MAFETSNNRKSFDEQRIPCSLEMFRVRAGLFLVVAWTLAVFSNFYINSRYVADVFAIYLLLWYACVLIAVVKKRHVTGRTTPHTIAPPNDNGKLAMLQENLSSEHQLFISIIIPCRSEQHVVERLICSVAKSEYSRDRFQLIVVNDHSDDDTECIVRRCLTRPECAGWLSLVNRESSGGGKAGAMNAGYTAVDRRADVVGYIDADAAIASTLLKDINDFFLQPRVFALQVARIVRPSQCYGLLERFQYFEVWMDLAHQQGREAIGGAVEFRGNGEFMRLDLLDEMGGAEAWNPRCLTDDLDMSTRLHLAGYNIALYDGSLILDDPVHTWSELWFQRQKWMTGGFQRLMDYAGQLVTSRMSTAKKLDFFFTLSVNFFGAATMCWRAAMDNATWTVVGAIIPTHSTIPSAAAAVNADITNPATITALVQSSAVERWVTLALCPLYLVNLGLAAMDACHKAPFFPRQLEYRKAEHQAEVATLTYSNVSETDTYRSFFLETLTSPATLYPIMMVIVVMRILLLPAMALLWQHHVL